jgi:hypothetical protein
MLTVIFSKNRPMQLDALLRSLARHCADAADLDIRVLYRADGPAYAEGYRRLREEAPPPLHVTWVGEKHFKSDLVSLLLSADHVLFLVDDTLFVSSFGAQEVLRAIDDHPQALGFSLRLGENTRTCYSLRRPQRLPPYRAAGGRVGIYDWRCGEADFAYPLEVSSSVYRTGDIVPLLLAFACDNPNTLEEGLAQRRGFFAASRPQLLTFRRSVAFSCPLNKVQTVCAHNRSSANPAYAPERLAEEFLRGRRLDVDSLSGFLPEACHQEVPVGLTAADAAPLVSVVIPCYRQAEYLPQAVESVVRQTYRHWEIVIVNDGSPDATDAVARRLIAHHRGRPVSLVSKANGGLSDARNAGIRASKGRYILPLDADDMIHPEMIARGVGLLESDPHIAIAYTDLFHFGEENRKVRAAEFDSSRLRLANQLNYCSLYRREVWEAVGGYRVGMRDGYEDWDFWLGCLERGFTPKRIPGFFFFYRVKPASMFTRAQAMHPRLVAQIVLNHPALYAPAEVERAREILGKQPVKPRREASATASRPHAERLP